MMQFAHPEAFLLVPIWGLALWLFPRAKLQKPLRIGVLLLLMMAWADPFVNHQTPGLDLWVLNDLSLSTKGSLQPRLNEMENLLKESKGKVDELFFVDFADEAILRDALSSAVLGGRKDASRLGNMLQYTLSQLRENRSSRLLLLSDGFSTDPVDLAGDRLLREEVPLDLRLVQPEVLQDVRVESIEAPMRIRRGDPFLVEGRLRGPSGTDADVVLLKDGVALNRQSVQFSRGEAHVQWTARMMETGSAKYEVRVEAENDAYRANNSQVHWVEAGGEQEILLLSAYVDDPLATLLRESGRTVRHLTRFDTLHEGSLSGVGLVIIHNVHAADVPQSFIQRLPFYVTEQGGGLIMAGGKSSFGSGGYFESALDPLLPVSMELKEEDRKLSIAMAIVMDRSGSMSAGTAGGRSKMDLANAGAARAVELMGETDSVTVFAVDTTAHQIVPLSQVGRNREQLTSMVRRIRSAGGGIYVFNGLDAAWKQLQNAPQPRRHIILFSDAADSEQPQGVDGLLKEMLANDTTVSVIALGSPSDPDAPFLEQIAEDGDGRLFFNSDASTLPAVFAQETVSVSRSAFLEEVTGVEPLAGWQELAAVPLQWPEAVDGYNLSYLREGAAESLRSTDQYQAPLLSHWQRGMGRVAAVSLAMGGPFSERMRSWPEVGDFVRTLGRWAMREELPPGLSVRMRRVGETLRVQLYANEDWQQIFALNPPQLVTQSNNDDVPVLHAWRRIQPGMVETDLPLASSERVQGVIQVGEHVLPFGPVNGVSGAEWEMNQEVPRQLRGLSSQSGGQDRLDLAGIWDSPSYENFQSTRIWWLLAAMSLFLFEALWQRIGGQRLALKVVKAPGKKQPARRKPEEAGVDSDVPQEEPVRPRSALQRAKDQRRT